MQRAPSWEIMVDDQVETFIDNQNQDGEAYQQPVLGIVVIPSSCRLERSVSGMDREQCLHGGMDTTGCSECSLTHLGRSIIEQILHHQRFGLNVFER